MQRASVGLYKESIMSDRDQIFCSKLVEAVEKHPCLYNYSLPDYSNKIVVEKAWKVVANEVDTSVAICRDKWRNIRTVFSRNLKPDRSGGKRKKPYYLNDALQFLVRFVKPTLSDDSGNLPPIPHEKVGAISTLNYYMDEQEELDLDEPSTEFAPSNTSSSNISQPASTCLQSASPTIESQDTFGYVKPKTKNTPKKGKSRPNISATDKAFIDFCSQQSAVPVTEDNPRKMFLLSLVSDVESMTDQQFRKFRMKVLPLIDGILSEHPPSIQFSGTSSENSYTSPARSSPSPLHTSTAVHCSGNELLLLDQQYQPNSSDWWQRPNNSNT